MDVSFVDALCSSNSGQSSYAKGNYAIGSEMFDGKGMNDYVFQTGK